MTAVAIFGTDIILDYESESKDEQLYNETKGIMSSIMSVNSVVNAVILAYASWKIRKAIRELSNAMPN